MPDSCEISWEQSLLELATQGGDERSHRSVTTVQPDLVAQAYTHCDTVTAWHSRSFSLASHLLPLPKRQAVRALYAFCRTTDDLVDHPTEHTPEELCDWWRDSLGNRPPRYNLVAVAWNDARSRYNIPRRYAEQLIEGCAHDIRATRYATFTDLAHYCYGVASTVGLMSMHIIGYQSDAAIRYAVKLGVALQLTNILRDIGEDWANGRLYLPREEMDTFNLTEEDIDAGEVTDRWRAFMRFQIARTRRLYEEAWPGIALLNPDGRLAIVAAADFYRAILADIERHDYNVFNRRAHIGKWSKLSRVPRLWWQTRTQFVPL
jgi:phytoene synthase